MNRKTDTIMMGLARIRLSLKAQTGSRTHYQAAVRQLRSSRLRADGQGNVRLWIKARIEESNL